MDGSYGSCAGDNLVRAALKWQPEIAPCTNSTNGKEVNTMANQPNAISMEDVLGLMAKSRNRGGYEARVKEFDASGEQFTQNILEEPGFQGKDISSVRNSLATNIKLHAPHVKVLYDKERNLVVLYNPTITPENSE